jgi:hypothetical protein
MLWELVGVAVLVGLGVLVWMLPLHTGNVVSVLSCDKDYIAIAKKQIEIQTPLNYLRELRNKKMSELISNIKVLKLFYWEKLFSDTISDIRSGTRHNTKTYILIKYQMN